MEIVRTRTNRTPVDWHLSPQLSSGQTPAADSFDYVDSYTRGYSTGRHDGALAGIFIGIASGVAVAVLLGSLI